MVDRLIVTSVYVAGSMAQSLERSSVRSLARSLPCQTVSWSELFRNGYGVISARTSVYALEHVPWP